MLLQKGALLGRLHPFGDDLQPQAGAQGDDGAHDGRVVGVIEHVAHKTLVNLELVQGQALEVGQRGVAGAKVIERKADAVVLELLHFFNHAFDVSQQHALGQLQQQAVRAGIAARQRCQHLRDKVGLMKLPGADVDRHFQRAQQGVGLPAGQGGAGAAQHPLANRQNQPALLGQRNEQARRDKAALRVLPAQQGLGADDASVGHLGLVVELELPVLQAAAHVGEHLHPFGDAGLHLRVVKAQLVAPGAFGLIHGDFAALQQLLRRHALTLEQADANAQSAVKGHAALLQQDRRA